MRVIKCYSIVMTLMLHVLIGIGSETSPVLGGLLCVGALTIDVL